MSVEILGVEAVFGSCFLYPQ